MSAYEHDWEPVRGLPQRPPPGEAILWQGAPDWRSLALDAFLLRPAALYLGCAGAAAIVLVLQGGEGAAAVWRAAGLLGLAALAGGAILASLAWLYARSTVYTITSRRVVIRFGLAIPKAVNLPFSRIEAAALKLGRGGVGDLALTMHKDQRAGWLHLWPFVRPGRFAHPQPMLRAAPQAQLVAALLARALRQDAATRGQPVSAPAAAAAPRAPGGFPEAAQA